MITIRAKALSKQFGKLTAVADLSLEIEEGEIFGLVGPDGAGKTTTMRMLTGILEPSAGDAWICDDHIIKDSEALKEKIAYMPQRFGLYEDLTVMENIDFYADIYGVSAQERKSKLEKLLGFTNL